LPVRNPKKRYYRKDVPLFRLVQKIRLWPSRRGVLHGVRAFRVRGPYAEVETHCGQLFRVRDSRKSRAARWLRNKWVVEQCKRCRIPQWKLRKFEATVFSEHWGSELREVETGENRDEPGGT
jgi:pyrrolysyl-tRNA synthetase-like protein